MVYEMCWSEWSNLKGKFEIRLIQDKEEALHRKK